MFKFIRKRVTVANLGIVLAVVFVMTGGAYAASKYVISSTKQISPKVLKSLQGKRGATGPQGPVGPIGPAGISGKNGTAGATGSTGLNGESVTAQAVPTSNKAKCGGLGGVEYTLAGKTTLICNGQTGFTQMLPSGQTETGTWVGEGAFKLASISFPIPLKEKLTGARVHIVNKKNPKTECPGTVEAPAAEPGNLCVYEVEIASEPNIFQLAEILDPTTELTPGAATSGALLVTGSENKVGHGSFAVTAE